MDDAEKASVVSPEFGKLAANIDIGHIFEGEPAKVHSRLAAIAAIGSAPLPPNGGCFYRSRSDFHTEAVVVRWLFKGGYSGSRHMYNGAMFLFNMTSPDRSTIIPNSNGKDSIPPDFKEINSNDPRCSEAVKQFIKIVESVEQALGQGPWPGMPLLP